MLIEHVLIPRVPIPANAMPATRLCTFFTFLKSLFKTYQASVLISMSVQKISMIAMIRLG